MKCPFWGSLHVIASIISLVAAIAGFVLIGLLDVLDIAGTPVSFMAELNQVIQFFQNLASIDPATIGSNLSAMIVIVIFAVTYICGLIFIIKTIVDLARINKENGRERLVISSLKLSFTSIIFFGMLIFFTYCKGETGPGLASYIALGLGGLGAIASAFAYYEASERSVANKVFRICLMVVAFAASVLVLMPTIVVEGLELSPAYLFLSYVISSLTGSIHVTMLTVTTIMVALLLVESAFANAVGCIGMNDVVKEDAKKEGRVKKVLLIVLSLIAAVLVAGAFFGVPLLAPANTVTLNLYSYIALGAMGLAAILAIIVAAMTKGEKEVENAQEVPQNPEIETEPEEVMSEEEPQIEEEPAQEEEQDEPEEEVKVEETAYGVSEDVVLVEEVAEEPAPEEESQPEEQVEEEPVEEEPLVEEPAQEEEKVEEQEEAPIEEPAKEEAPKAKEAPKKKAAPAKKAPTPEKKEEPKEAPKKNTASYHVSKRASDNKWQVFRAGSTKVIKLFDTKVEAEEYTKRMAENQDVGYLSHASKGKNKGRIQKK